MPGVAPHCRRLHVAHDRKGNYCCRQRPTAATTCCHFSPGRPRGCPPVHVQRGHICSSRLPGLPGTSKRDSPSTISRGDLVQESHGTASPVCSTSALPDRSRLHPHAAGSGCWCWWLQQRRPERNTSLAWCFLASQRGMVEFDECRPGLHSIPKLGAYRSIINR